jgi:type II secretory pathway component PulF
VVALNFQQREQLFHELAQFARSGVPLNHAFEILSRNPRREIGVCLKAVREKLKTSGEAGRAFREAGFSESDAAVIEAGEATGRLDTVFLDLEAYYRQLANARRTIIAKSLYPVLVLHLGAVLLAIPPAIIGDGGWPAFFAHALPILAAFYAALFAGAVFWRIVRALLSRDRGTARFLMQIPLFGAFLRDWTAWRFASVLSLYVGAGGGLLRAFETAGSCCGNAVLRSASASTISLVRTGHGLTEAFKKQKGIPKLLERAIEVGEHSGRLDEETRRAAEIFKEKTLGALDALAQWIPRILYILIVLFIGWRIIRTAFDVANSINSALNVES